MRVLQHFEKFCAILGLRGNQCGQAFEQRPVGFAVSGTRGSGMILHMAFSRYWWLFRWLIGYTKSLPVQRFGVVPNDQFSKA